MQAQIENTADCRQFQISLFCSQLGVTNRALWLWRQGTFAPKPKYRATLERLTDGAVPASIWER